MKAQPAGLFPPLHTVFVKSEEFLQDMDPESEKRGAAKINTSRKKTACLSLWLELGHLVLPATRNKLAEFIDNKLHAINKT